jgi:hypothetical protein
MFSPLGMPSDGFHGMSAAARANLRIAPWLALRAKCIGRQCRTLAHAADLGRVK